MLWERHDNILFSAITAYDLTDTDFPLLFAGAPTAVLTLFGLSQVVLSFAAFPLKVMSVCWNRST